VLARGDRVCANGGDDGRVGELRLRGDDAVCDEVVDALDMLLAPVYRSCCTEVYRVLLLLDLDGTAILEGPLDYVGLLGYTLDELALLESRPELAEVLELDQVPDIAEGCLDDGRLADGGGGGDTSRHFGVSCAIGGVRGVDSNWIFAESEAEDWL
jgi:hypothetical protein